ncbi:MAG: GAF domain-containing protein [Thermoleophilia bacterium]|nr:GAF domain-containing protein [Thermoleophilia bacterium]
MNIATSEPGTEREVLAEIISTVASSLELDEVLRAVVRLLSEASAVHACFVYLIEDDGQRLVMKAASDPFGQLVGRIGLERGEGLAWWAVEQRQPGFIRENALADPRFKYVPELAEERFQSLVSIPILARDGSPIGAISLHTEAPREFTPAEADTLVASASLVAGAIENARLYAEARLRVGELERLTELGEAVARAETLDELLPEVAARSAGLLGAAACHVYLLVPGGEELRLRVSFPPGTEARATLGLSEVGPELARAGRSARLTLPLVANAELLGLLEATETSKIDLARAVASQTAVAIKKIDLIERLTEKNLIKDFFELLASGAHPGGLEERAGRLGFHLGDRHLVLAAAPPDDRLEKALATLTPGSLFDRRDDSMRALLHVQGGRDEALVEGVRRIQRELAQPVSIGLSSSCRDAASFKAGFEEARHALLGASVLGSKPAVMSYEELGPYKYLLRMSLDSSVRDRHRDAVARLAEYDRQRSTSLLATLEEHLRRHGNISATAKALYVHPNTLRQRLRRIQELSGVDLRRDDWLMVEIAVKLVRLQQALGTAGGDTPERSTL